jgi:hypothetical protein
VQLFEREREKNGKGRKEMSPAGGAGTGAVPRPHKPDASIGQHPPLQWLLHHLALELNAKCKARFPEYLAQVMRQLGSDDRIACIIHDEFMYFSQETTKDLKLPSIVLRTASAANFFARDALFQLKAEGHLPFPGYIIIYV